MDNYLFPEQKVLCNEKPFSRELLGSLLERVFSATAKFTGYLKFAGNDSVLFFLFFFNGDPYAAGKYAGGKPVSYSIQELGEHLVTSAGKTMTVTLCETDPVLLKSMLLFLQEDPAVKAPTSLIDLEFIVRQISEGGTHALIALCRDMKFNFFFFRDGKGAIAHISDQDFERPEGMTVDEEMLLYAFQPGSMVEAHIFRTMSTSAAADAYQFDRDALLDLLTGGKSKNCEDEELVSQQAIKRNEVPRPRSRLPRVVLTLESGPQQGERYTVTLPCTIGRRECDLVLNDGLVSRRHAELKIVERKLVIEDLASTNGTRVNGETVSTKRLAPNDLISIGESNLRITPI